MSVYCKIRKDGTKAWYYNFMYKDRRYRAVGGTTKTEALRAQEKIRSEVLNGEYELKRNTKNPTIEVFAEKFLERRRDTRSYGRYVILVQHLLRRFKGRKLSSSITSEDVEDYKGWRKAEGVKNATVNRELACLKRMYNLAILWGDATRNPVNGVKYLHEPPKKDRFVTREEAAKLINAASDHFKPILVTVFYTGMRLQEVLGLKWDMVRLWDMGGEIELIYTKNGKKRYIPLNETMRKLFLDLERKGDSVFIGTRNEPLKSVRKPLATAVKRAGIEKTTFHDFRHSWASWMSEAGVDPYTIMEIGGWSSLKILERYLHRTRAQRQSAVERIDGILSKDCHLFATSAKVVDLREAVS